MANHSYTIMIQNTEPSTSQLFWIWINQDTGGIYLRLIEEWIPIGGGDPFSAIVGIYWRTEYDQTSEPGSPSPGDGWLTDVGQSSIYLDKWVTLVGG